MTPALRAFAAVDFHWTKGLRDVWSDPPYHVDALHGDLVDRLIAEFFARTRKPDSNPIGQVLPGRAGVGKTHLIGTLRRRVWEGGGWFVLIDIIGIADFWRTAALAYVESLSHRMPNGQTQASAILRAVLSQLTKAPAALIAVRGRVKPTLQKSDVAELLVAMLGAVEPAETRKHQDVVRALALLDSPDMAIGAFASQWLQGYDGEEARRRELNFVAAPPPPAEIVRGLHWIMSLSGPTLIAVDQIDSVVSEANAAGEGQGAGTAILQTLAGGLMELHDLKRRAMTLVTCLEATWASVKEKTVASAADRFRELAVLPPITSATIVERLIVRRLAEAYAETRFTPPYPSYPFARSAIASAVGLRPRAILMRCQSHQDSCLGDGEMRECDSLASAPTPAVPPTPPAGETDALDDAFARAKTLAQPPQLDDEAGVAALLVRVCELYLGHLSLPESIDGEASPDPNPRNPALHARLAFVFHDEGDRQSRWSFRLIGHDHASAFQSRLRAAITASGLDPQLASRHLVILRTGAPPAGPKTAELTAQFIAAGGVFLAPTAEDFATFAALRRLAEKAPPGFAAWLRQRQPLFQTKLFQAAGLAPPTFLSAAPARPAPAPPPPGELPSLRDGSREILIGRIVERGEVLGPASLPARLLPRHVAIIAGSGAGKSVLLSRIVEEAALIGAPSLVLDAHNDLARLGEPWPSRPAEFSDDDARKASAYFQRAEVVVWTPGMSSGRPLMFNLLPDFARLQKANDPDYLDERERAVEMALATLEPYLPGRGVKAMKLRGALADALRAFARGGGGSLDDLVRLLGDLPDGASRIAEAPKLAREIAEQLLAAMATEPSLRTPAAPFDPAALFESPSGKTRVSVVNLSGLGSDAAQAAFVNQLQMTLFTWIKDHPSPTGRLYVLDEAQLYAPARESTACKKSALALVKQARKYGLGMIFATQEPRGIDHAILSNCLTHVYGRVSSPASLEAVRTMMAAKGEAADDLARLKVGEFYFATEGFSRPLKIRTPLCLSRRTANPPTAEEVAALARRDDQARNSAK